RSNGRPSGGPSRSLRSTRRNHERTALHPFHAGSGQARRASHRSTVANLIANGNPTSLSIGDNTWIEPGTKTAIYGAVTVPSQVLLPVVVDLSTHSAVPIVAFAPFQIDDSQGGS